MRVDDLCLREEEEEEDEDEVGVMAEPTLLNLCRDIVCVMVISDICDVELDSNSRYPESGYIPVGGDD